MRNTVLIVDDNDTNLQLVSSLLNPYYKLLLANDGTMALKTITVKQPDIILLDIMMPGISGYEVCKKLKANEATKHIPVIFLTAKTEEDDIKMAYDSGAVDYITKPFKEKEILARIKTQLELLQTRNELILQNEKLKSLIANRDRFFSVIAHDLRSPFNGLLGITQMISLGMGKFSREDLVDTFKIFQESVHKIYELLNNLLEWSKIQRDIVHIYPEDLILNEVITDNIEAVRTKASLKNISITYEDANKIAIRTDKNILGTILRNLFTNALKFSYRGGCVTITAHVGDNDVCLVSVKDEGVGIDEYDIPKLFKIEEKLSRPGTENEPSSGLGLILCKEFIEKLGGTISVEKNNGKGTTFSFTIKNLKS